MEGQVDHIARRGKCEIAVPDYLGNILVPEIAPSGVFPLVPDYPHGRAEAPEVVIHQFGSGNAKIEQRFLLGTGAKRFTCAPPDCARNSVGSHRPNGNPRGKSPSRRPCSPSTSSRAWSAR